MREYLAKRIVISFFVVYMIATLNFVIYQCNPAINPALSLYRMELFPKEVIDEIVGEWGLKEPLHIRYIKYITNMFTFNFGYSFLSRKPVVDEMLPRLSASILLLGTAFVVEPLCGIPLGILAASKRKSKIDITVIGTGLFAHGVPAFFVYVMVLLILVYFFYLTFGFALFPASGMYSLPQKTDPLAYISDVAWHMALPILALLIKAFGSWALYTRNLMIDALTQDYVATARAKGLRERTVLYRHAFRSTLPPIATMIALRVPGIIDGAMILEFIFSWPGMGQWYLKALNAADFPVMQTVLFLYAVVLVIMNIVADLIYGVLDPRIRVGGRRR